MTKLAIRSAQCAVLLLVLTPVVAAQEPPRVVTPRAQTPRPSQEAPRVLTPKAQTPRPYTDAESDRNGVQAFSVILVLGDMQTATIQETVPAAARKALADMKDFLPYKGYRLLDAQWTLCCAPYPMTSRLKGADEQEYELRLTTNRAGDGRVNVGFNLTDAGTDGDDEGRANLEAQIELVRKKRAEVARKIEVGAASSGDALTVDQELLVLQRQLDQAKSRHVGPSRKRAVIDTAFRMDVGETVVVGTSRIKGDKALIALLTAVPVKAASGRE
jgi:hypothetical protein